MKNHRVSDITPADGNVFEDLGFEFDEAVNMKHRATLAAALVKWIDAEGLKQEDAAERLGVKRPEISNLKRARLDKFSLDKLIKMLQRAGKSVTLTVA